MAELTQHAIEGVGMLRREFEPCQKIERLSKFAAVMQAPRDLRKIFHPDGNVPGLFLEYRSAFVLSEIPPGRRFAYGNECRPGCARAGKPGLPAGQFIDLMALRVAGVARHAAQYPIGGARGGCFWSFDDLQPLDGRQRLATDRDETIDSPWPG